MSFFTLIYYMGLSSIFVCTGVLIVLGFTPSGYLWDRSFLELYFCFLFALGFLFAVEFSRWFRRWRQPLSCYEPNRIIIFMPNHLSDAIMARSFVKATREFYNTMGRKSLLIDLVIRQDIAELFYIDRDNLVNNIIEYRRDNDNILGVKETWYDRLVEAARLITVIENKKYDLSILLTSSERNCLISMLARIPRRLGYLGYFQRLFLTDYIIRPFLGGKKQKIRPMTEYYKKLSIALGHGIYDGKRLPQPQINLPNDAKEAAMALLNQKGIEYEKPYYVCVAPGANRTEAIWPAQNYFALVNRLQEANFNMPFIYIFGPKESKQKEIILKKAKEHKRTIYYVDYREVTLPILCALIKESLLTICNDSPYLHIARLTDSWALALCGPTIPLHHSYRSKGYYKLLYPQALPEWLKTKRHRRFINNFLPIDKITVNRAVKWSTEMLNRSILFRKLDNVIREIAEKTMNRGQANYC